MDYAIYKTIDRQPQRTIHSFTQTACNHRAKIAAKKKLNEMWLRIISRPDLYRNAKGDDSSFSYDYLVGVGRSEHISFFIAKL